MTSRKEIELDSVPNMENALFIACFEGWGNALEVSRGMANFLINKLNAEFFGKFDPDQFFLFKERRPDVVVIDGILKKLVPPGCELYAVKKEQAGRDIIILKGAEPDIGWFRFTNSLLSLCREVNVKTVVSCAGLLDNILHTDKIISVVASNQKLLDSLQEKKASLINYQGQSSIHSTLHSEAKRHGFDCVGLYCHCPYYLQGVTHFGLLSFLGDFLSEWAGFELDTEELQVAWKEVNKQIQEAIGNNPELKDIINDLRKSRAQGEDDSGKKSDKVIKLEDYFKI
jgi:proteasome assembly chaperone (PAC2) family protein